MDHRPDVLSFESFSELVVAIGKAKPRQARARAGVQADKAELSRSSQLLQAWIKRVKSDTDPAAFTSVRPVTVFFRLFFPEHSTRRRSVSDISVPELEGEGER